MIRLETHRLILRPFRDSDFEDVHAYARDPEVCRYQSWGPNSEQATRDFLTGAQKWLAGPDPKEFEFGIELKASNRLLGGCGFRTRRAEFREFEIGWTLNRDFWRQGIGTEAVRVLIAFAFRDRKAHRLYAVIDPENVASAALAEKLGFRREGLQRSDRCVRGEWRDSSTYALLETDERPGGP
ncbi:GNAT family N-acetyltransferase [Myxococcota bacterium]|nr:GNAT family N-acetyltransferase [Myxococcota bacterium]